MTRDVVTSTPAPTQPVTPSAAYQSALAPIAIAVGLGLALVGILDLTLLWVPSRFGDPEWEFVALTNTFDSLPLPIFGLSLLAAGLVVRARRSGLFALGIFFILLVLVVLAATALFALGAPVSWRGTPPQLRPVMTMLLGKTAILALVYIVLTIYLASFSFKQARSVR